MSFLAKLIERADGPATFVSAYDAIGARLGEAAGFDGIWTGGYEIAASRALPDANILTATEYLNVVASIVPAISLPVLADCDNGFGNALNTIRTVECYGRAGVAGITLEDTQFPKRALFYPSAQRRLVSVEEHAGKVRAAVDTRRSPEFGVIARMEGLVFGMSVDDARARAEAYVDAGADGVMIMTDPQNPDPMGDLYAFAERWDRECPLIAAPTKYSHVTSGELYSGGFSVVIFATVAMRAAIRAIEEAFAALKQGQRLDATADLIVPMARLHELIDLEEFARQEREYIPVEPDVSVPA